MQDFIPELHREFRCKAVEDDPDMDGKGLFVVEFRSESAEDVMKHVPDMEKACLNKFSGAKLGPRCASMSKCPAVKIIGPPREC